MKGYETLENAYLHMKELLDIVEANPIGVEMQWFERAKAFVEDFKTWTPEVFIYLEGGCIQGASANCNMHFNLWDDDNEKEGEVIHFENEEMSYKERHKEWNTMIEEDTTKGIIKPIY